MMDVTQELCDWNFLKRQWWVMDAFATRREESIEEAREILLKGLVLHYDDALIRYNLGCYACVLKSYGECIDFLKEAVRRDERVQTYGFGGRGFVGSTGSVAEVGMGSGGGMKGFSRSAFSLIELLVVVAILGIIVGIFFTGFSYVVAQQNGKQAKMEITAIRTALENYRLEHGDYPRSCFWEFVQMRKFFSCPWRDSTRLIFK